MSEHQVPQDVPIPTTALTPQQRGGMQLSHVPNPTRKLYIFNNGNIPVGKLIYTSSPEATYEFYTGKTEAESQYNYWFARTAAIADRKAKRSVSEALHWAMQQGTHAAVCQVQAVTERFAYMATAALVRDARSIDVSPHYPQMSITEAEAEHVLENFTPRPKRIREAKRSREEPAVAPPAPQVPALPAAPQVPAPIALPRAPQLPAPIVPPRAQRVAPLPQVPAPVAPPSREVALVSTPTAAPIAGQVTPAESIDVESN
jgi:hypothetical protein